MSVEKIKCLIIGSGPAGYTAAIYASRANLSPVLYQGEQPGGQLTTTNEVENFPGYPKGITGTEMMMQFEEQAHRFEADIRSGWVTKVDFSSKPLKVWVADKEIHADTVLELLPNTWDCLPNNIICKQEVEYPLVRYVMVSSTETKMLPL